MIARPVAVTGATGFVGSSLVAALLERGAEVTVFTRDAARVAARPWGGRVQVRIGDVYDPDCGLGDLSGAEFVHLVWGDLDDFHSPQHLETHFPAALRLLRRVAEAGAGGISVAGTCQEYGMREGRLGPHIAPDPQTPYACAKDRLRRALAALSAERGIGLRWFRFFYIYGRRQKRNSLYPQLLAALARGDARFAMSEGTQLRDFIDIEEAARQCGAIIAHGATGCFDICGGRAKSVRDFVAEICRREGGSIVPEYGVYPMPDYEPFAFWGEPWKAPKTDDDNNER